MPNILIDIDDTLADLSSVMLDWVNDRLDPPLAYDDLTREHREKGSGRYQELVNEALREPGQLEVLPYPGALAAVRKLHAAGYGIHIASARKEHWHRTTCDWLAQHGFTELVRQVHPRSSTEKGTEFKRSVAERIQAVAAFDDTINVVLAVSETCPRTYLIDRPWNRGDVPGCPGRITRAAEFASAARHFLER